MSTKPHHHEFEVPNPGKADIKCTKNCSTTSTTSPSLIFTHGAGGNLYSDSILNFRTGFATQSPITCFQGPISLPSRTKMFTSVIEHYSSSVSALGGRSMGARAAVMAAKERKEVKYLVLVSYPLHTNKGDTRDDILMEIEKDVKVLFVVGSRDEMCDLERLEEVRGRMRARSWRVVVREADHGMGVRPKGGTKPVGELIGRVAADWVRDTEGAKVDDGDRGGIIWWDEDEECEKWSGWCKVVPEMGKKLATGVEESAKPKTAKSSTANTKTARTKTVKSKKSPPRQTAQKRAAERLPGSAREKNSENDGTRRRSKRIRNSSLAHDNTTNTP